jgi:hypothetical protein
MSRPLGQALPRGTLLRQRVKDAGESERRSVMGRIGVGTLLRCERGQTSRWSWLTKELTESSPEEMQMNMEQSMCAASGPATQWEQIDWTRCEQKVRRLQARIVKATQEGRHGKVKALHWLLTHSFHGRALAVKRVTHNKAKNTSGVDRAVWRSLAARYRAIDTLRRRGYQPPCLHTEGQWKAETAGDPHDEGPRDAGALPAGAAPHRGDNSRF